VTPRVAPDNLALLLGLSFFFGLAFEEFYAKTTVKRPGGVRTFPLLSCIGAGLFLAEPVHAVAFTAGLIVLGLWLYGYYREHLKGSIAGGIPDAGIMVLACNLVAYSLGPLALLQPSWVVIGFTVVAVLLLGARERLHSLAHRIPEGETATLGKFLVLTGIILPLVPRAPVTELTPITPYQVWLAVVAVSTLSYGSYLVQRYVWPARGIWLAAALGGLYSSTATTVMLARRLGSEPEARGALQGGIVLATAMMYARLELMIAVLNLDLGRALALPLGALALAGAATAAAIGWRRPSAGATAATTHPGNPLELSAALLFAGVFVLVSLASAWVRAQFGVRGLDWLAAIVGVSDIDPFVLSLAQGGGSGVGIPMLATAILIAASSNNLLKAGYAIALAGRRPSVLPALSLIALAAVGGVAAWLTASS
jgi:uncharacterized membrane protein (DUF4010 family)